MSIKSQILLLWRKTLNKTLKLVPWTVSGLDCRRREFQRSQPTFISKLRKPTFNANYESAWKKQASWCFRRETDLFPSNSNEILDYQEIIRSLISSTINYDSGFYVSVLCTRFPTTKHKVQGKYTQQLYFHFPQALQSMEKRKINTSCGFSFF